MAVKVYSIFPKPPGMEPPHQMLFCVINRTLIIWRYLTPLQRCSRYILLSQLTGQVISKEEIYKENRNSLKNTYISNKNMNSEKKSNNIILENVVA